MHVFRFHVRYTITFDFTVSNFLRDAYSTSPIFPPDLEKRLGRVDRVIVTRNENIGKVLLAEAVLGDLECSPRNFVTIRESMKRDFVTCSKHDIMRPTLIVKPVAPTFTKITSNVRPGQGSKKVWEFNGGSRTFLLLSDGITIRGSLIY